MGFSKKLNKTFIALYTCDLSNEGVIPMCSCDRNSDEKKRCLMSQRYIADLKYCQCARLNLDRRPACKQALHV